MKVLAYPTPIFRPDFLFRLLKTVNSVQRIYIYKRTRFWVWVADGRPDNGEARHLSGVGDGTGKVLFGEKLAAGRRVARAGMYATAVLLTLPVGNHRV